METSSRRLQNVWFICTASGIVVESPWCCGSSRRSCGGSSSEAVWCTSSSSRAGTTCPYDSGRGRTVERYGSDGHPPSPPLLLQPLTPLCSEVRLAPPLARPRGSCPRSSSGSASGGRPALPPVGCSAALPAPAPAPPAGSCTWVQLFTLPRLSSTVGAVWSCRHWPSMMNLYWCVPGVRSTTLNHSPDAPACLHCIGIFCHCVNEPQMYAVLPPCGQSRHTGTVPVSGGGSGAAGASCSAETSLPMPVTARDGELRRSATGSGKAAPRVCACGRACKARRLAGVPAPVTRRLSGCGECPRSG